MVCRPDAARLESRRARFLTTQSGSARSAPHPSFTDRIAARLDCVVKDLELSPLFGPLWQYAPAAAVTPADGADALARVLVRRAERILEHTPAGLEYQGGMLADATIRTALFAESTPHCTLADVYRARKEPEATTEADVFSVENTEQYVDEFVSAVSVLPGKTKSASARFLGQGDPRQPVERAVRLDPALQDPGVGRRARA